MTSYGLDVTTALVALTNWISQNKEWFFSGLGVTAMVGVAYLVRRMFFETTSGNPSGLIQKGGVGSVNIQVDAKARPRGTDAENAAEGQNLKGASGTAPELSSSVSIIQGSTIIAGLTYADARQIALDVFRQNALALASEAASLAKARAEEITEQYLRTLQQRDPQLVSNLLDPDLQHALFQVQKDYARSGDQKAAALLIELLVRRSGETTRTLKQIILNEAIETVGKLSDEQIEALSLIFMLRYVKLTGLAGYDKLLKRFKSLVLPFSTRLTKSTTFYEHLVYAGAASLTMMTVQLPEILAQTYPGLFSQGLSPEQEARIHRLELPVAIPLTESPRHSDRSQLAFPDAKSLQDWCMRNNVPRDSEDVLTNILAASVMPPHDILAALLKVDQRFNEINDVWLNSPMNQVMLTSVGKAIAHANVTRALGDFAELDIWLA